MNTAPGRQHARSASSCVTKEQTPNERAITPSVSEWEFALLVDAERDRNRHRLRREAHAVITRLIAQRAVLCRRSVRCVGWHFELCRNGELTGHHRKRLLGKRILLLRSLQVGDPIRLQRAAC